MDLILWRHAEAVEAQEGESDLGRPLTPRGQKQAARVAGWLNRNLPESTRVLCSPALRCEETVMALDRRYKPRQELGPDAQASDLIDLVRWPLGKGNVLVVGHQPTLGAVVGQLLGMNEAAAPFRKAGVWWLRYRVRDGIGRAVVVAVQSPDTI